MTDTGLEQLKMLFEYTKFHIGLYTAVATIIATAVASKNIPFTFRQPLLLASIASLCLAGFAGGIIASSIPHFPNLKEFWGTEIGPFRLKVFKAEFWTYIEHTAFWLSIMLAVASVARRRR